MALTNGNPVTGDKPVASTGSSPAAPTPAQPATNFLGKTPTVEKNNDAIYKDFFQEGADGNITVGIKAKRSGLEIFTGIMKYVAMVVVTLGIIGGLHVFIRSSQNTSFFENYPFLCAYLNYDVNAPSSEKQCKNIGSIKKEYDDKYTGLRANIADALTEYIPIKVTSNLLDASPERGFAINTFNNKILIDKVLSAFESVKSRAQYIGAENIQCTGVTVAEGNKLSTQCTILGGAVGATTSTGSQLGSSRIEALRFMEGLADTPKSSFILENPPTSLSIEELSTDDRAKTGFSTRTIVPIQLRYVPMIQKI